MALKIVANPTFPGHADITVAGQDALERIKLTWRHKTAEQMCEWFEANKARPAIDGLMEIIADCPDLTDADGQPVPFSREVLQTTVANYPPATGELVTAWLAQLTESRTKNLKALPAG